MQRITTPQGYSRESRSQMGETRKAMDNSALQTDRGSNQESSTLDITQRIERKLAQYNASQSIFQQWVFEICSWTLSALCMGAIIGILVYLRDQPLSKWPLGLTVVSVLSKIASAALILPISEAIGQLKWAWFTTSKEIYDFEIFDKASRGAWGSLMLLLRTKGKSLAALGALLTLLLLAIDTFFQQVTNLPERWTLHGASSIARVVRYDPADQLAFRNGLEIIESDPNIVRITRSYFYENGSEPIPFGNGTQPEIPISCPTSKCEWEPYETLGVCSACADMSNLLTYACLNTRLDWLLNLKVTDLELTYPNGTACGYYLNVTSATPILMSGYQVISNGSTTTPGETLLMRTLPLVDNMWRKPLFGGSINFKQVYFPFVDALIVSAVNGSAESVYQKQPPVAQECMLSLCVKKLKSSYYLANYKEEVIDTFLNTTKQQQPLPWVVTDMGNDVVDYVFNGNISIYTPTTDPNTAGFGVGNLTFVNTVDLFDEMFPSSLTVAPHSTQKNMRIKFWVTAAIHTRRAPFSPWLSPNNVTHHMERFATAMTNVLRSNTRSNEFIPGKAYSNETFVSVKWEWLTFPLALLLLSLIFLVATILRTSSTETKNMGVWKTSAMPTLIYSLPEDTQKGFASPRTWAGSSSSNFRSKIRVRLLPDKGWRVSGRINTPVSPNFRKSQAPPGWI